MADTKTSALSAATTLDGTELVPVVQGGTTKKATATQLAVADSYRQQVRRPVWFTDCLGQGSAQVSPYTSTAIASGTIAQAAPPVGHPGVIRLTSSTSANSGYKIQTDVSAIRLSAGDLCEMGFAVVTTGSTTVRVGFHDSADQNDAVDGVYCEIVGTTASFKSSANSTRTTAASTFTITATSYYRVRIEMIGSAQCDCTMYDDTGAVVLATQSITTNLPTASGRQTGVGLVATNSGTTAVALVDLDYLFYERKVGSELTR